MMKGHGCDRGLDCHYAGLEAIWLGSDGVQDDRIDHGECPSLRVTVRLPVETLEK